MMNKNVVIFLLLTLCCLSASAQYEYSSRITRETDANKSKTTSLRVRSDRIESQTYEGARNAALNQAVSKCLQYSDSTDVKLSFSEEEFDKVDEMNLQVRIIVRKNRNGLFEATCSITGDGKENLDHYPKR